MPENYYISEVAYTGLANLAIQQGFVRPSSKKYLGMSNFLEMLSFCDFEDTRPDFAIEMHKVALSRENHPKWVLAGETRISRFITLSPEAMKNYTETALRLEIIVSRRLANGGQSKLTLLAIVGIVLEAIGLEWITPVNLPVGSYKYSTEKKRKSRKSISKSVKIDAENPYVAYTRREILRGKQSVIASEE